MSRSCRALAVLLIASAAVAVAGCGTYLPPAPLDDAERAELESLRTALGDRTIVVVEPHGDERIAPALRASGFSARSVPAGDAAAGPRVEVAGTSGGRLRDPWMTIFGVFVIPVWTNAFAYDIRVSDGAREIPCECTVGVPMVYGWLAQPLLLLPRWQGWLDELIPRRWDRDAADRRIALTIARNLVAAGTPE